MMRADLNDFAATVANAIYGFPAGPGAAGCAQNAQVSLVVEQQFEIIAESAFEISPHLARRLPYTFVKSSHEGLPSS